MKLDNKGFAISTILYGLLIMASLVLLLLMSTVGSNKRSSDNFVDDIENSLNDYADSCYDSGSC